jgi:hypothetical protein
MPTPTPIDLFEFRRFLGSILRTAAAEGVRVSDVDFAAMLARRLPATPTYTPPIQRCAAAYADQPGLVHAAALSVCRTLATVRARPVVA